MESSVVRIDNIVSHTRSWLMTRNLRSVTVGDNERSPPHLRRFRPAG